MFFKKLNKISTKDTEANRGRLTLKLLERRDEYWHDNSNGDSILNVKGSMQAEVYDSMKPDNFRQWAQQMLGARTVRDIIKEGAK